ncbi:DUF930 domain-containing protein [Bosea sp. (in: a-proteobacteria)]|jgi:hypothetical protein|uniref:DUF930 domain-containing protein n=1 Tax=Bosea sp. (in: a-proteobacteria) TaxID=1871050 RepID=UPI002DDD0AC1|nr:DUF930 domain-containing protein [Bosea sp. (in: a-proteobacteria)]HEV2509586.1 DUF930 domain-containing protein [Bosea sp. (in: a-proteobacteria)]
MQRAGTVARVLREPGLPAALCFHLLFGLLLAIRTLSSFTPPAETSIEVELIAPEALTPTPPAPVQAPAPPPAAEIASPLQPPPATAQPEKPATPPVPPPAEPPAMITARTLHSDSVLANPRSRGAREALKTLEASERIEQLCNLEAMSQIHAWKAEFEPDRVVAFAMASTKLTKTALEAEGAAFRSRKQWYGLRFRCEMAANGKVAGFQFRVGEAIPRSEWAAHDLPPEH